MLHQRSFNYRQGLRIVGEASVVGEDASAIITGRCNTTVGGGGGWEEVYFGPE
jgi:hypothetical protein